ncbi:hypothetical protein A3Q56_05062 [Intoshia linei]|uniref:Uncharacterized protein n=1 Tax=Intoshia linei TaxID=1819745 RepID=A0A177B0F9_9BILA|nr:hypothetical protein A3Q56_05062 [Intoshia linei]
MKRNMAHKNTKKLKNLNDSASSEKGSKSKSRARSCTPNCKLGTESSKVNDSFIQRAINFDRECALKKFEIKKLADFPTFQPADPYIKAERMKMYVNRLRGNYERVRMGYPVRPRFVAVRDEEPNYDSNSSNESTISSGYESLDN